MFAGGLWRGPVVGGAWIFGKAEPVLVAHGSPAAVLRREGGEI